MERGELFAVLLFYVPGNGDEAAVVTDGDVRDRRRAGISQRWRPERFTHESCRVERVDVDALYMVPAVNGPKNLDDEGDIALERSDAEGVRFSWDSSGRRH